MEQVVKTTVFIKEMNDFAAINEVYAQFFTGEFPARSCVEVARLPKDVMLEIEAIAMFLIHISVRIGYNNTTKAPVMRAFAVLS